ncbi:MAG: L-malate glycosyltransferase [Acidobacteriota bacterium]|jgi:glycosyltransferase involved in cell wall biosynthesis|nr:L-malate glycosyltransferase [Acidobacteriota bacterium]
MRILHLAAGNRWTGAAAPAFAEVEALRAAGIDAHYAYVGGYKLQAKLAHLDFAHPIIEKAQNPLAFRRSINALDRMIHLHGFEVIHAHLTYDHWLARFAARPHRIKVARTFHARRVLRTDPFTRSLVSRTDLLCVVNDTFAASRAITGRPAVFTPPPLDTRQFTPAGADVRAQYGIDASTKLVTVIGKLSKDRGFEEALQTFAALRPLVPAARLMIIGHGEHRPALEAHAASLGIRDSVLWAGYHEDDLAEHYRASDLLLFTARGSDEGHRAVLEAMGCGVPPATFPIDGVAALLGELATELIAPTTRPEDLAAVAARALKRSEVASLRTSVAQRAQEFSYLRAAARLLDAYTSLIA